MRRRGSPRIAVLISAAALLVTATGCATPAPSNAPRIRSEPPRIVLPETGRPYTPADMLAMLGAAPRSGMPAELVRPEVAEGLANAVWTFDGRPYRVIAAEGSCGPQLCELSVQGVPDPSDDSRLDHYIFNVDSTSFELTPEYIGLRAFPADIDSQLDALARAGVPAQRLVGMSFDYASWLIPPEFGRFEVIYDEGGLEGSRGLRVLVDARIGSVIRMEEFTL